MVSFILCSLHSISLSIPVCTQPKLLDLSIFSPSQEFRCDDGHPSSNKLWPGPKGLNTKMRMKGSSLWVGRKFSGKRVLTLTEELDSERRSNPRVTKGRSIKYIGLRWKEMCSKAGEMGSFKGTA